MSAKRQHQHSDIGGDGVDLASERRCAVTRAHLEPDDLIRFVRSPTNEVVPDLERRLPGRGAWLTCSRDIVKKAIASKAFAQSFKAQVNVPADLAERIETLMRRRLSATLALANKAGLVIAGFQQVDAALDQGQVAAILHAAEAAPDGRGKIDRKFKAIQASKGREAPIVEVLTVAEMSLAMGRPSVVHAALTPGGLTARFLSEAERMLRYRTSPAVVDEKISQEISRDTQREG